MQVSAGRKPSTPHDIGRQHLIFDEECDVVRGQIEQS